MVTLSLHAQKNPSPAYDADAPTRRTQKLLYFKASLQNSRGQAALGTEARHLSFMLQASLHGTRAKNITHTGHSRLGFRDALALIRQGQESDQAGMRLFLAERQHRSILERDKLATLQLQDHRPHRRCMASSNVLQTSSGTQEPTSKPYGVRSENISGHQGMLFPHRDPGRSVPLTPA